MASRLVLAALLLSGCHRRAEPEIVVPRSCIDYVDATPDTECRMSKDGKQIHCKPLKLSYHCISPQIKEKKK